MASLRDHLGEVVHYPEPQGGAFKRELARYLDIPPHNLMVGNGATELIYCFCQAILPRRALIPAPTFGEYARAIRACGGEVHHFWLQPPRFRLPVDCLAPIIQDGRYDLVVLCNPNNPTGTLVTPEELILALKATARAGSWLLLDESFLGFLPRPEHFSARRWIRPDDAGTRLAVLDSFTKLYCLPGLRLGYLIGPAPLIARMEEGRDPWSVSVLAQVAGIGCLNEHEYVQRTRQLLPGLRRELTEALAAIPGLHVLPSATNFLLLHTRSSLPGSPRPPGSQETIATCLKHQLILVRDCSDFPGLEAGAYIRVAVRLPDQNERLVYALQEVIADEG